MAQVDWHPYSDTIGYYLPISSLFTLRIYFVSKWNIDLEIGHSIVPILMDSELKSADEAKVLGVLLVKDYLQKICQTLELFCESYEINLGGDANGKEG